MKSKYVRGWIYRELDHIVRDMYGFHRISHNEIYEIIQEWIDNKQDNKKEM